MVNADPFTWDIKPANAREVVAQLRQPSTTPRTLVTVNTATMHMATIDDRLADAVENATLRIADGMGVVWTWRLLGRRLPERVAGIDMMENLIGAAAEDGRSIYLLGATQEVVTKLVDVLTAQHPNLTIAGYRNGFFDQANTDGVIDEIASSGADILFIGMPSPFKETWANDHLTEFGADLVVGVGGSFDVFAGVVPRAPRVMQRVGLEWLWRLACEPRRMWKRYAQANAWLARHLCAALFTPKNQPV